MERASAQAIQLGYTVDSHEAFEITLESVRRHTVIFAGSGSGKTVLIRRLVEECARQGVSSILLDPNNVAAAVRLTAPRARFEPFAAAEGRKYLRVAKTHRHGPLFELAMRTGLRQGELLSLKWDDLDLDAGHLTVRRTLARTPAEPRSPT